MNHDEIRELLHAYADGELDLINAREIMWYWEMTKDDL